MSPSFVTLSRSVVDRQSRGIICWIGQSLPLCPQFDVKTFFYLLTIVYLKKKLLAPRPYATGLCIAFQHSKFVSIIRSCLAATIVLSAHVKYTSCAELL